MVEAEGTVAEGDATIGVFCRDVPDTQSDAEFEWYEFVVNDGFGAIRRSDDDRPHRGPGRDRRRRDRGRRRTSPSAECAPRPTTATVNLWLTLDGETLLQASDDDPLPVGLAGRRWLRRARFVASPSWFAGTSSRCRPPSRGELMAMKAMGKLTSFRLRLG